MARKTPVANVNPTVLRWARESAGIEMEAVARRLNVKPETVSNWEDGGASPTLGTLEKLAALYKRSLAALFLPRPPEEPPVPRDFRVLRGGGTAPLSPEARLALREARRVQGVATELADELGEPRPSVVGSARGRRDAEALAAKERARLGVSVEQQRRWRSAYAALRQWRAVLEGQALLTLQLPVPLAELRGCSFGDGGIPTIVLNSRDAVHARIFTLLHEYAHLLRGTSALCIPGPGAEAGGRRGRVEAFCNRFAGAFLVPPEALREDEDVREALRSGNAPQALLGRLSARFRVSREVVLHGLRRARLISSAELEAGIQQLQERRPAQPKARRGGPPPAKRCVQQKGEYFANLVFEAQARDLITYSDVADYLSVRVKHFDKVQSLLQR
ncbi:MAG: ImmA/IrrE family metallo-endopeptidase [Planctomycetota bacterium]